MPIQVWATVVGTTPLSTSDYDGLQFVYYGLISGLPNGTGTAVPGGIASPTLVAPFNAIGSQTGAASDLNGDGVTDLGSTVATSATSDAKPRYGTAVWNDNTSATTAIVTNGVEFLVETVQYSVSAAAAVGESTTVKPYAPPLSPQETIRNWWSDNPSKCPSINVSNSGYVIGTGVTFTVVAPPMLSWNNAAGGVWSLPTNWSPSSVPVACSTTTSGLNASYGVTFNSASTARSTNVSAGAVTLNMGSQSLQVGGNLNVFGGSTSNVLGAVSTGAVSAGQLTVSAGSMSATGR